MIIPEQSLEYADVLSKVKDNFSNYIYLITNLDNGAMNGNYMTSKTGQIISQYNNLFEFS